MAAIAKKNSNKILNYFVIHYNVCVYWKRTLSRKNWNRKI